MGLATPGSWRARVLLWWWNAFGAHYPDRLRSLTRMLLVWFVIGTVGGTIWLVQQRSRQRDIDAHAVEVTGRLVEYRPMDDDHRYTFAYTYEDRRFSADVEIVQSRPRLGDAVCLEIDTTVPDRARVCGTHGDLDRSLRFWVAWTSLSVLGTAAIIMQRRHARRAWAERAVALASSAPSMRVTTALRRDIARRGRTADPALPSVADLARRYDTDEDTMEAILHTLHEDRVWMWRVGDDGLTQRFAHPTPPPDSETESAR